MFTGIVQIMGKVARLEPNDFGVRLVIDPCGWDYKANPGDSISVSGCCLTYASNDEERKAGLLAFDVIKETLDKTSLGRLAEGSPVNLEPAVTANTPMGGHFVQGHIDGTGDVVRVVKQPDEWRTTVKPPEVLRPYIVPKGSVSIDGVSLTIASIEREDPDAGGTLTFDVALIPTTLEITTLGQTEVGDIVNLEADMIAKTVVHWLDERFAADAEKKGGVTVELLRQAGFAQ